MTQADDVVRLARDVLGPGLVGVYLHGSAVAGGLRRRSDLDLLVVAARRTSEDQRRELVRRLLPVSGLGPAPEHPRPVELTVVVASNVRPWRYPPLRELQYGEWLRDEHEAGHVPASGVPDPDLAIVLTAALATARPLFGPPLSDVLGPVPRDDLLRATVDVVPALLHDLRSDTRNVVLTLARVWSTLSTGEIRSKDEAAAWALERLPDDRRAVLARAGAVYRDEEQERWDDLEPEIESHVDHLLREIDGAAATAGLRPPSPPRTAPPDSASASGPSPGA